MKHCNALLGALLPLLPATLALTCAEQLLQPQVQLIDMSSPAWFGPEAISSDGSRVVGIPADRIWVNGAFAPLTPPHGGFPRGVSDDGGVIVGMYADGGTFRWDHGVVTRLADPDEWADLTDLSADGSVAVGWDEEGNVVWHGDEPQPLATEGFVAQRAHGVSADGETIVGIGRFEDRPGRPFFWHADEVREIVGPSGFSEEANSFVRVSGDGSTALHHRIDGDTLPFRWRDGVSEWLLLPDGALPPEAFAGATSGNGEVIVGAASTSIGGTTLYAFIWDATHGMRKLEDLLVAHGAVLPPGAVLKSAWGISDDGRRIIGEATGGSAGFDFIVTLPPACADGLDNDGDGLTDSPEDPECPLKLDLSESE